MLPAILPVVKTVRLVAKVSGTKYMVSEDGTVYAALKPTLAGRNRHVTYNMSIDYKVCRYRQTTIAATLSKFTK